MIKINIKNTNFRLGVITGVFLAWILPALISLITFLLPLVLLGVFLIYNYDLKLINAVKIFKMIELVKNYFILKKVDYKKMKLAQLKHHLEKKGIERPRRGSGAAGRVLKQDIISLLQ